MAGAIHVTLFAMTPLPSIVAIVASAVVILVASAAAIRSIPSDPMHAHELGDMRSRSDPTFAAAFFLRRIAAFRTAVTFAMLLTNSASRPAGGVQLVGGGRNLQPRPLHMG